MTLRDDDSLTRALRDTGALLSGWPWLAGAGALCLWLATGLSGQSARALSASGWSLLALIAGLALVRLWSGWRAQRQRAALAAAFEGEAVPVWLTDHRGVALWANPLAGHPGALLTDLCAGTAREPGPLASGLAASALSRGSATAALACPSGPRRLTARQVGGCLLWRVDPDGGASPEAEALPRARASADGALLHVTPALRALLGRRPETVESLFVEGPPRSGEIQSLQGAEGPLRAFVALVPRDKGEADIVALPEGCAAPRASDPTSFEGLPVPLLRLSPRGEITAANRAARGLLGATERGQRLGDLFEGLGRPLPDWLADALHGRSERKPEVLRRKGVEGDVFIQVTLVRVMEGERVALMAILADATQMKTLEGQMLQSQKMHAIGQLAGGVAHDFNNLLTAIAGHCDLLLLRHDFGDPDFSDIDQIRQNANRAAALVSQLLAFSRKQTLAPRHLDLRDVIADLGHLMGRLVGEKVSLTISHPADLPPVRADRRQVEQVIVNLVVNARDAMGGAGQVRLETERLLLASPQHRGRATIPSGEWAVVKVTDHGIGMTEEVRAHIFEPFFTTKHAGEGTGLGLSTVYGIMKQSGGFVFCDSALGMGAVFTLYFPAATSEAPEQAEPAPPPRQRPTRPSRLLLVEDEASVRAFAARALRLKGHEVLEADCGEAALALLEQEEGSFDLFISDVIMPGIDGPGWVQRARQSRPEVPVLFVSGYAQESFGEDHAAIPNTSFLPKPFSLKDLIACVDTCLAGQAQSKEA